MEFIGIGESLLMKNNILPALELTNFTFEGAATYCYICVKTE
jgi:hypothetical protein